MFAKLRTRNTRTLDDLIELTEARKITWRLDTPETLLAKVDGVYFMISLTENILVMGRSRQIERTIGLCGPRGKKLLQAARINMWSAQEEREQAQRAAV